MKNEMVLSTKDLQEVGINTQLSSNDLIEVVAHDIYEKYVDSVNGLKAQQKEIQEEYSNIFSIHTEQMKSELIKAKKITATEKVVTDWNTRDSERGTFYMQNLRVSEESKGLIVKKSDNDCYYVQPKKDTLKIELKLTVNKESQKENIKVGNIEGYINIVTEKQFTKIVLAPTKDLKEFIKKAQSYNERVKSVIEFLPKNGILSVERFTREARVKMNKKIISGQSPEFRQKMSQLFNIKL